MWKKALANISIPVWLFFFIWFVRAAWSIIVDHPEEVNNDPWVFYPLMGFILTTIAWILFFWGRWIWRVVFRRQKPIKLEWPE